MDKDQITKAEISLPLIPEQYEIGTYLFYKGNSHSELYVITEDQGEYMTVIKVDASTLTHVGDPKRTTLANLKAYYTPVCVDIDKSRNLALRVLNGENFEKELMVSNDSTELMYFGSKDTLISLREENKNLMAVVKTVQRHATLIADEIRDRLEVEVKKVHQFVAQLNQQITKLDYVIQTIETYAGIKEEIVTIQTGAAATEDTPVVIRQAVIYLDEEMALIDHDFDWQKISSFDQWLLQDGNYKAILPDIKSIVAIKPRRKDKRYSDGNTLSDSWYNWIMNERNHVTLFLIRNGENLYRIESEHIALDDRLFPNANEYQEIIRKETELELKGWQLRNSDKDSDLFRKRFTKVSFLLQGLFDRSDVFTPHNFTGNLIKMQGLDGQVEMLYELDLSKALGDGRPPFSQWIRQLNEGLSEGKRILLINKGLNREGYVFNRNDFVTYYSSDWNIPDFPEDGIYTLYNRNTNGLDTYYEKNHPFVIKYKSQNESWSWSDGFRKRKNRTSIHIGLMYDGILNYDDLKMEDVDYYLHSRLHRSQYYQFVVMLQKAKNILLEEQKDEDDFVSMMVGQIMKRELMVKDGKKPEEVVRKSISLIKERLKWKRPLSTKEKETYTLVERILFSKKNIRENFKTKDEMFVNLK